MADKKGFYNKGDKEPTCLECGLSDKCKNSPFSTMGNGQKKILIITEYPTKKEDDLNEPLNGKAYEYLRDALNLVGVDMLEDCWITYAIRCKPTWSGGKLKVPPMAYKVCRKKLLDEVEELKPRSIITLGSESLKMLIGHRTTGRANFTPFDKWLNQRIPDQELNAYIYPLNSPKMVLSDYEHPVMEREFILGLEEACREKPFIKAEYGDNVFTIFDESKAIETLKMLKTKETLAFDYETTGLKPQRDGHKILAVSFSDGMFSWAFPIFDSIEFHRALRMVINNPRVKKIIHNLKYEILWSRQLLNYDVANVYFDTMIAAHVLDMRKSIYNLKFQTYVNFGILGYDDEVDTLMKATREGDDPKDGNRFNRLEEADPEELCFYCGLDSLFTYKLYEKQVSELNSDEHVWNGYRMLHNAQVVFTDMEWHGVKIDVDRLNNNIDYLNVKIGELHKAIMNDPVIEKWDGEGEFNYNSNQQLSKMLYEILGYPVKKLTNSGSPSTDKEALEEIPEEFIRNLLTMKKLEKLKTTYLVGIKREQLDGIIRPNFEACAAQSGRSGSRNPNFQNLSAHDEFAREMVLSTIIPKNDFLVAIDEKSLEVMIGACYHKDPMMLKFLSDEDSDMHKTVSTKVFMCSEDEVTKEMRYVGKTINFSSQYGSSAYNIAITSWDKLFTKEMRKFVQNRGIKNFNQWVQHIEGVMKWYWEELFGVFGAWVKKNWQNYQDRGVFYSKTGMRYKGVYKYTQVGNFAIQGTAAHLVEFAAYKINEYIKKNKMKTQVIMYIHDSIEFDVVESEWEELKPIIHYWMTKGIQDNFPWVIAPLGLEAEYHFDNFSKVDKVEKWGMYLDKSLPA